jgi:hypothetical protein
MSRTPLQVIQPRPECVCGENSCREKDFSSSRRPSTNLQCVGERIANRLLERTRVGRPRTRLRHGVTALRTHAVRHRRQQCSGLRVQMRSHHLCGPIRIVTTTAAWSCHNSYTPRK